MLLGFTIIGAHAPGLNPHRVECNARVKFFLGLNLQLGSTIF